VAAPIETPVTATGCHPSSTKRVTGLIGQRQIITKSLISRALLHETCAGAKGLIMPAKRLDPASSIVLRRKHEWLAPLAPFLHVHAGTDEGNGHADNKFRG
jgi:hypothetical protein